MMTIRVLQVGLGPIGAAVARQLAARKAFRIVGAVDIDPSKMDRDAGDVAELGRPLRVKVSADLRKAIKASKPDIAVLCTSSSLRSVMPQLEELLKLRVPVVSTTEELAYPAPRNRRLAKRIDELARKSKVAVLGTGVNPGFAMDALPIALTAVCERVESVTVHRVQDARARRLPFQQKIGAGLTREQFSPTWRMVPRSTSRLNRVIDEIQPKIAETTVSSEYLAVDAGYVSGIIQDGVGYRHGTPVVTLHMEAYLGAPESYDAVRITGNPPIAMKIAGGGNQG
jgi:4-hydroxy-tetrahydrodipicolinate reductase